jgi:glycosyltransferase involved in cell wall biosynthesis
MNIPDISVVIPAYNAEKYIAESVESVLQQTFPSWELLVIDDGSTDHTAAIVEKIQTNRKIILIRQQNQGVAAARNAGIKAARGRFITFLDADDYYLPDNLLEKYNKLTKDGKLDFVYCDVIHCDEKLNEVRIEKGANADNLFREVLQWQKETIPTLPSNIMVKTSLMKTQFLFDENLSNCADRYLKIEISQKAKGAYIPLALVKYRNTPGSMSKKVWLLERDELYIIKKIIEKDIIPPGNFRRKVIANIYFTISGSWYKDAHKPFRAFIFILKAILIYPPSLFRLLGKFQVLSIRMTSLLVLIS